MMTIKPTKFFKEKADFFQKQLNEINLIEPNYSFTKDIYKDKIEEANVEYYAQGEILNDIKLQMKLMLSEFDNGKLFLEKIENFRKKNIFNSNSEEFENLKKVNQLFIDFLNEYRN